MYIILGWGVGCLSICMKWTSKSFWEVNLYTLCLIHNVWVVEIWPISSISTVQFLGPKFGQLLNMEGQCTQFAKELARYSWKCRRDMVSSICMHFCYVSSATLVSSHLWPLLIDLRVMVPYFDRKKHWFWWWVNWKGNYQSWEELWVYQ